MPQPKDDDLAAIDAEIVAAHKALKNARSQMDLLPSGEAVTKNEEAEARLNEALDRRNALIHPAVSAAR